MAPLTNTGTIFQNAANKRKEKKEKREEEKRKEAVRNAETLAAKSGIDIKENKGGEINPPSDEIKSLEPKIEDTVKRSSDIEGIKAKKEAENDPMGANIDKAALGKDLTESTRNAGENITGNVGAEINNDIKASLANAKNDIPFDNKNSSVSSDNKNSSASPTKYSWDDAEELSPDEMKSIYDTYKAPKNGAEYLKRLWNSGRGGKAAAIGNVLGNFMGAVGGGKDYVSDWQKYKDNYIKAEQERNQREYNDAMDIVKLGKTNEEERKNILAKVQMAIDNGMKLTPDQIQALKMWQLGTGNNDYLGMILAPVFASILPSIGKGVETFNKYLGDK